MSLTSSQIAHRVRNCKRFHVKVLLEFLGVSDREVPTKINDAKSMLSTYAASNPDAFEMYYDIVVRKKMPEGNSAVADLGDLQRKVLSAMIEHCNVLESAMDKTVSSEIDKLTKSAADLVTKKAEETIEIARKQFVTHQVKVGNKKAKQIGGVVPKQFTKLIQLAQQRKNILMVGPSGCGKTHVAGMIAEALDLDYSAQSCSAGISESIFAGWLLPLGKGGNFEYATSEFVRIYENGGVFLLDEFDNTDPNLAVFLNMAIAQDHFFLPQRFNNRKVVKHKDFVCIAAANTHGHGANSLYSARTKLDAATKDRFRAGTVVMDYDETVESAVVKSAEVLKWGRSMRAIIKKHKLEKLMSTRVMIDFSDMIIEQDWTFADVQEAYFSDWSPEEKAMIKSDLDEMINQQQGLRPTGEAA